MCLFLKSLILPFEPTKIIIDGVITDIIPTFVFEEKKKCANCNKEVYQLSRCDECKQYFCFDCRYDGYDRDVWVLTFCYDCQPELRGKRNTYSYR